VDYIVVTNIQPWDGRYELDLTVELTTREWGWIKRLAGYLPVTLEDNSFSDPELACVLAAIMMKRAGRIQPAEVPTVFERLADAPFGSTITIEAGEPEADEEADAGPPARSLSANSDGSGSTSPTNSETSAPNPRLSGTPGSATSAYARRMSAI
jgi:hypothetical protein